MIIVTSVFIEITVVSICQIKGPNGTPYECKFFLRRSSIWLRVSKLRPMQTLPTLLANKMQHCWAKHVANICTPCCVLLHIVATCWKLLDEVWNWSNFRANKCQHFYCFAVIEAWSNNLVFVYTAHPTMLRCRTRTTCHVSIVISIILFYSHPKTQHVVTCCKRLHTSANIVQQETTMLRVVASVCTGLYALTLQRWL